MYAIRSYYDPDQQAHGNVYLGHFHLAQSLEQGREALAQQDARPDTKQDPEAEEAVITSYSIHYTKLYDW